MKQPLKHLTVLTTLILAPLSSEASLQVLMGGGAEPDPHAMHFPTFFSKACSGKTIESSASFLSQDGVRTLKFTAQIVTTKSKKSGNGTGPFWTTKAEEKTIRSHLPSLAETPGADDVFEHFSTHIIETVLGTSVLPKPEERVDASFVSELLKLADPSKFFEITESPREALAKGRTAPLSLPPEDSSTDHKRKHPLPNEGEKSAIDLSSSALSSKNNRLFKRRKFTKELALNTLHASTVRSTSAQITLGNHLSHEDLNFTQAYLAGSGFLQLTLESFPTPEETLSNKFLLDNARRIPIVEGAVINELQEWLAKHCNALYKTHVLDKGGESLYH